jgi:hypothetical protein
LASLPGSGRTSTGNDVPARRGSRAPLDLAGSPGGRSAQAASFSSGRAPPPLDFRSAAPPPAPSVVPEPRPAATAAPAAAAVDLEAISRDVMSRFEKRLRVERERRGRS